MEDSKKEQTKEAPKNVPAARKSTTVADIIFSPTWSNFLIPVAIAGIVYVVYRGMKMVFHSI